MTPLVPSRGRLRALSGVLGAALVLPACASADFLALCPSGAILAGRTASFGRVLRLEVPASLCEAAQGTPEEARALQPGAPPPDRRSQAILEPRHPRGPSQPGAPPGRAAPAPPLPPAARELLRDLRGLPGPVPGSRSPRSSHRPSQAPGIAGPALPDSSHAAAPEGADVSPDKAEPSACPAAEGDESLRVVHEAESGWIRAALGFLAGLLPALL